MTTPPEPPPVPPAAPSSRDAVQLRIAMLRAEIEAKDDPSHQALLHFEMGALIERHLRNDAMAVKEYLTAYTLASGFRPPLFALIRIFERRRSFNNLERLYSAEAKSATRSEDRAAALIDRGVLLEDHLERGAEALPLYREAIAVDAGALAASLMLERATRRGGDRAAVEEALSARARQTVDPTLQSLLLAELAWERIDGGAEDDAFETIRQAVALPAGRWRSLEQMERMARRSGRTAELVQALEGRAELAAAAAQGRDQGLESGAFSVQRFADESRAATEAATLLHEAARLRVHHHGDAEGAARNLTRALALRPEDVLLRQEHMLACELAGDIEGAAADARLLLEGGISGRFAAALHFRLAELAQSRQDTDGARAALTEALEANPGSAAALALLDDLLLDLGRNEERISRLEARAEEGEPEAMVRALWRAAQIAAEKVGDFERARVLYQRAIELAEDKTPLMRELYGAARRHGILEVARDAARALLSQPLEDEEHAAIEHALHDLLRYSLDDAGEADSLLAAAVAKPENARWAPDLVRLRAAESGDAAQLAVAHDALAHRTSDDETGAAHLCAAARALVRTGNEEGAMERLRSAMERSPGHRYAVALLEEILRSRGEADEVVNLLRAAAAAQAGAKAAELNLLLAGAAAEATGDPKLAAETFEEAADRDPTSLAPLWSLRRLAERTNDMELLLKAREALAEREVAAGEAGRATLELGEHYDLLGGQSELAEKPLRSAVPSPEVGAAAAAALCLLPGGRVDAGARLEALERLARDARGEGRAGILRAMGAEAMVADDPTRAETATDTLIDIDPRDRWAHWARIRLFDRDPNRSAARADAWVGLAGATDDSEAWADLMLHALRAKIVAQGADASDDAFLLAQEIAASSPEAPAAGVALDETLAAGDDPESRAEALSARLMHAGRAGGAAIQGALGRTLISAGRHGEAVRALRAVVSKDSTDLAAWESLRVAAREESLWEDVVRACDQLCETATGEAQAQLLEEAAAVLMDELGRDAEAEERLRRALEVNVERPIAFGRLHDLMAERGDTAGLAGLVRRRIDAVDDSDELVKLFYEQARLLRVSGDYDGGLAALDNLLMLDGQHAGGLALRVEIHVKLEQWEEAVDSLRDLADAGVPAAQQRVARMGAADFLEKRLKDPEAAIAELRKVVELGLADAPLHARIADIARSAGDLARAVEGLRDAAQLSEGAARAAYLRRAGDTLAREMGDAAAGIDCYRAALVELPTDLEAGEAMSNLLVDPVDRQALSEGFEGAVRAEIERNPTDEDTLRKLRRAAAWRGDRDLELRVLGALAAMGLALPEEDGELRRLAAGLPVLPSRALGRAGLATLRAPGFDGPVAALATSVAESVAEMDRLEPATYGVSRGNLVSAKTDNAVRDELARIGTTFGIESGDFYSGGPDAALVVALPGKKDRTTWVVGDGVRSPLGAGQRFVAGQLSMASHERVLPYVQRSPGEATAVLFAAAACAEAPLPAAAGRADLDELARNLSKKMPRRVRKGVPDLVHALPDGGRGVEPWCRAALRTALRAGLLVAGDLGVALSAVLGPNPGPADVGASGEANDLLLFWISPAMGGLRRELGLLE